LDGDVATHSENSFDNEVVEFLQCNVIGPCESPHEFLGFVALSILESFAGEGESAKQPKEAFSCGTFFLPLFVLDERF